MRTFWTVMKFELILTWKNWITWLIALAMLVIGAVCASNNRQEPYYSWNQFQVIGLFISLILVFCTGNQINRDRERHLAGIILSTPVATPSYVCGKYLGGLVSLLLLTGSSLLSALLMDHFSVSVHALLIFALPSYPPLGAQPYLIGWTWLTLTAIIFGATFMLACITLTRGQRAIASIATLLIWILPIFISQYIPDLLDITATVFYPRYAPNVDPVSHFISQHPSWNPGARPPDNLVQPIMHLSLAQIPPSYLPSSFLWNRLFFLGLSLVLLVLTIYGTHALRRHA